METFEEVEKALRVIMTELDGRFPTPAELRRLGKHTLVRAIISKWGGFPEVRKRMGIKYLRIPYGSWRNVAYAEEKMREAIRRNNGQFPTSSELRDLKCSSLEVSITTYHGGLIEMKKRMGYHDPPSEPIVDLTLRKQPKKVWTEWRNVEEGINEIITVLDGLFPTQRDLNRLGHSGLSDAIAKRYNGIISVRNRMGYEPVTDNLLATNANDLAQIVIELGVPTDRFWTTMKKHWVVRDLNVALEEFKQTESVERFRTLLDSL